MVWSLLLLFDWSQTPGLLPCPCDFMQHQGIHFPDEPKKLPFSVQPFFIPVKRKVILIDKAGLSTRFVLDNFSFSKRAIILGLHVSTSVVPVASISLIMARRLYPVRRCSHRFASANSHGSLWKSAHFLLQNTIPPVQGRETFLTGMCRNLLRR